MEVFAWELAWRFFQGSARVLVKFGTRIAGEGKRLRYNMKFRVWEHGDSSDRFLRFRNQTEDKNILDTVVVKELRKRVAELRG